MPAPGMRTKTGSPSTVDPVVRGSSARPAIGSAATERPAHAGIAAMTSSIDGWSGITRIIARSVTAAARRRPRNAGTRAPRGRLGCRSAGVARRGGSDGRWTTPGR